jgi:uncharacterized integral membrane protein
MIGILVVLALAIAFIVENHSEVRIHFVFFTVTTRMWVGFLVSLALGAALGRLATFWWRTRQQR